MISNSLSIDPIYGRFTQVLSPGIGPVIPVSQVSVWQYLCPGIGLAILETPESVRGEVLFTGVEVLFFLICEICGKLPSLSFVLISSNTLRKVCLGARDAEEL